MNKDFIKYETLQNTSETKWLYLFNTTINGKLPNNSFKFGMTTKRIKKRIRDYRNTIDMSNIECIQCNHPEKRETLLKRYLNKNTNLYPIYGKEYYTNCRDYIKKIIYIIVNTLTDNDVLLFNTYYTEKNKGHYGKYFEKITKLIEPQDFVNIPLQVINKDHICAFCKKEFLRISSLNHHMNTSVFCHKLREDPEYATHEKTCEGCDKVFNTKALCTRHKETCKDLKIKHTIDSLKEEIVQLKTENTLLKQKLEGTERLSYKEKITKLFNQLPIYTEEAIQNKVKDIQYQTLPFTFINQFVDAIKSFVFCTDISRNKLVIKREENNVEKITAEYFILLCITDTKLQILSIVGQSISHYIKQKDELPYDTYIKTINHLISLKTNIMNNIMNPMINETVKHIVKTCIVLSK